jgi:hypothetical protein
MYSSPHQIRVYHPFYLLAQYRLLALVDHNKMVVFVKNLKVIFCGNYFIWIFDVRPLDFRQEFLSYLISKTTFAV